MNSSEYRKLYTDWSQKSRDLIDRARAVMPGGDTRASAHYLPYPLFMSHGEGARIFDVEGRSFLDCMNTPDLTSMGKIIGGGLPVGGFGGVGT